jgi:hypothetical protein
LAKKSPEKPKLGEFTLHKNSKTFSIFFTKKGGWKDVNIIRNIVMERCNELERS